MLQKLKTLHEDLKDLKRDIQKEPGPQIAKTNLRKRAESFGEAWFAEFVPSLNAAGVVEGESRERYDAGFRKLIKLSAPNNLKTSYLATLTNLTKKFRDELILPHQHSHQTGSASLAVLSQIFGKLPTQEENEYLEEGEMRQTRISPCRYRPGLVCLHRPHPSKDRSSGVPGI